MTTSTVELLTARLRAAPAVAAIVGAAPAEVKIYANKARQGATAPYVVITVISDVPENTLDGGAADRLRRARVQVDSYAGRYENAHNLAEAVADVIGDLSSPTLSAWKENSTDLYDDDASLHRVLQEFTVFR